MSEGGKPTYTVVEFTEEVVKQLKGVMGRSGKIEFEVKVYNTFGLYAEEEINQKGICVQLDNYPAGDLPTLKYSVEWDDSSKESKEV